MDTGLIGRELDTLAPAAFNPRAIAFGVMHLIWQAHDDIEVSARTARSAIRRGACRMPSSSGRRGARS